MLGSLTYKKKEKKTHSKSIACNIAFKRVGKENKSYGDYLLKNIQNVVIHFF